MTSSRRRVLDLNQEEITDDSSRQQPLAQKGGSGTVPRAMQDLPVSQEGKSPSDSPGTQEARRALSRALSGNGNVGTPSTRRVKTRIAQAQAKRRGSRGRRKTEIALGGNSYFNHPSNRQLSLSLSPPPLFLLSPLTRVPTSQPSLTPRHTCE